jgi:hypothetical protein
MSCTRDNLKEVLRSRKEPRCYLSDAGMVLVVPIDPVGACSTRKEAFAKCIFGGFSERRLSALSGRLRIARARTPISVHLGRPEVAGT